MTPEEIRAVELDPQDSTGRLLREIAAQLAESVAVQTASSVAIAKVFDEFHLLLPKVKQIFDQSFNSLEQEFNSAPVGDVVLAAAPAGFMPGSSARVVAMSPPGLPADFDQLVEFQKSRGYSLEAARTIVGNHTAAVRADFAAAQNPPATSEDKPAIELHPSDVVDGPVPAVLPDLIEKESHAEKEEVKEEEPAGQAPAPAESGA